MLQTRRGTLRVVGMAVAVLVMTAGAAGAALAPQKPRKVPYTLTGTCAQISQTGSTLVIVCAGTSSIDGDGARRWPRSPSTAPAAPIPLSDTSRMVFVGPRRPSRLQRMPPA